MFLIDNYSPFFESVAACPISKEPLRREGDILLSPCGFAYRYGDLRVGLDFSEDWIKRQADFERGQERWLARTEADPAYHAAVDQEVADVYAAIEIIGNVLDVAGAFGMVAQQAQIEPETYVSVDAFPFIWSRLAPYKQFCTHYSECAGLTRVPAFAEFLQIRTGVMDVVHMRSCLDHFANPLLALREAFRVLKPGGKIIVGISLEGAYKKEALGVYDVLKQFVKRNAVTQEFHKRLFDHHMFHPTLDAVHDLIARAGFTVKQEVWQRAYYNVLYVEAVRS